MVRQQLGKLIFLIVVIQLIACAYKDTIRTSLDRHMTQVEKSLIAICHSAPKRENILGTGFIATPNGLVITADHVITDDSGRVYPTLFGLRPDYPNYEQLHLELVKRFRSGLYGRDIAILRAIVNESQKIFPFIPLVEADSVSEELVAEEVIIGGFPLVFGEVYIWPLFRRGAISSTRYSYQKASVFVLDLPLVDGFSGSPVISLKDGKVIGIMRGSSKNRPESDFSVASPITSNDLVGIEK